MIDTALVQAHAELGASSADRWMNCPGSINMTKDIPNLPTSYTREGTTAHKVVELALVRGVEPEIYIGTEVEGEDVTEEMVSAVSVFTDFVRGLLRDCPPSQLNRMWTERRFDLSPLNPPGPMFGTADITIFNPSQRLLQIPDYKHGVGYAVDVTDNPQVMYYGLGALLEIEKEIGPGHIDNVELIIVQPRGSHPAGIIRRQMVSYSDMLDFAGVLLEKAHATYAPDAPLNAGKHCRFCRAIAICPAQLKQSQEIAQMEFAPGGVLTLPPAPEKLPLNMVVQILEKADIVEDWLKGVKQWAINEMQAGREIPGFKLVQRRATRKILDPNLTREWLELGGYKPEQYNTEPKLKSPAQLELLILKGKKKPRNVDVIPPEQIIAESSGVTLAPRGDSRAEVSAGAEHDFAALPAATESLI